MTKKITIEGMTCGHCAMHVEEALKGICGVKSVEVNLTEKYATVELAHEVDDEKFKAAIEDVGYEVTQIYLARKLGIINYLKNSKHKDKAVNIIEKFSIGSDIFAVSIEGSKDNKSLKSASVVGNCESLITAKLAFGTIDIILSKDNGTSGIYHSHELVGLDDILPYIADDVKIYLTDNSSPKKSNYICCQKTIL